MWPFSSSSFHETIASKRAQRDATLSTAQEFSAEEHQKFLTVPATEIVKHIEAGEWTASAVLEAYIARTAQAQRQTNCITEVLFEQAREEAHQLDREFAATGVLKGPLHGVPVSFKDMYNVTGFDSTIGFTQWANQPASDDATIVKQLRAAGAIPFVKTNVPQTMLAFECSNPLWGRSLNPWSDAHTCGGSSGGEAALLALDGSALGIGSDVGGSLRIPASYCGIYALKPGFGRVAAEGSRGPNPGFEAVPAVTGPMARSVNDLEVMLRVTFGGQDTNYFPAPVPYRDVEIPKVVRFGYYTTDNLVKSSPVCQRALLETVEALRREGHECVEFELPYATRALELFSGITSADGYDKLLSHLGPDPKESSLFLVTLGPSLPGFVRSFAGWVVRTLVGDSIFGNLLLHSRRKSVMEYYDYVGDKLEFERTWRREVWGKHGFDAILAPVQAVPAIPHHGCDRLSPLAHSTLLYNVVDSPVGVVPVTRVDPSIDQLTDEWLAMPGGSKLLEAELYGKKGAYNPKAMAGLPVGVQIIGDAWEDEKIIGLMHVVDKALGPRGFGPGMWQGKK
ncbi:amidase [Artomyces pyxidatus]|uniref:Amidase n=1 Tax=Artomyces pyxidatus TaxID=48021 RepID=A0ACB8TBF2_9AGAM|nr:amidase [Artomyces pyxidatus]